MKQSIIGAFSLLLLSLCGSYAFAGDSLKGLQNGDFEAGTSDMVDSWKSDSDNPENSVMTWEIGDSSDVWSRSISIDHPESNDSYWTQTITDLKPNVTYLLRGKIKGEDIGTDPNQTGAHLFVEGAQNHTPALSGTFGWTQVHMTFTVPDDGIVKIGCRLGSREKPAWGKAWFDKISLSTYALRCSPHPPPFNGKDPVCTSRIYGSDTHPSGVWLYLWPQEGIQWAGYSVNHRRLQHQYKPPWELSLVANDIFVVAGEMHFEHGIQTRLDPIRITLADAYFLDADNDGYGKKAKKKYAFVPMTGYVLNSEDCNDDRSDVNPNGFESCNGLDDDCDGDIDEGLLETFYIDKDGDGHGEEGQTIEACRPPEGYAANQWDCDDNDPSVHPYALEYCNALDDDCDSYIDESCTAELKPEELFQVKNSSGDGEHTLQNVN